MELNEFANILRRSSNPSDYLSRQGFGNRWTQTSGAAYLRDPGYGRQLSPIAVSNVFDEVSKNQGRNPGTIPYVTAGIRKDYNRSWHGTPSYTPFTFKEPKDKGTPSASGSQNTMGQGQAPGPTSSGGIGQAIRRRIRKARGYEDAVPLSERPESVRAVMAAREGVANWKTPGSGATSSLKDSPFHEINREFAERMRTSSLKDSPFHDINREFAERMRNQGYEDPVPLSERPPDLRNYSYSAPTSSVADRPFADINQNLKAWETRGQVSSIEDRPFAEVNQNLRSWQTGGQVSNLEDRPESVKMVMAAREGIQEMSSAAKKKNAKNTSWR